jgi:tetratricopeptide (TPR) repeat protein
MAVNKQRILKNVSRYIRNGQWDSAVVELRKILAEDPDDCNILNQVGDCYMKKGETEKAVAEYEKAAEVYRRAGQNVKAIAMYRKILRTNPDMSEINSRLAQLFAEQGLIREAIEQYKSVADSYTERGEIGQVLDTYQHIVDLDPGNPRTRLRLAELYEKEGFTEKGVREYARVAEHFLRNDEVDQGLEIYKRAANVDPSNISAKLGLIRAYEQLDRYDEAMRLLNYAIDVYPDNIELLMNSGRINVVLKNFPEAQSAYEKVLRLNPNDLEARERLGVVFGLQGKYEKGAQLIDVVVRQRYKRQEYGFALKALKEFAEAAPDHLETHQKIAVIHQKLGQEEQEVKELEYIADYYLRQRKLDEAYDMYERLIQKNPENPDYRDKLDEITSILGSDDYYSDRREEAVSPLGRPASRAPVEAPPETFDMEEMESSMMNQMDEELNLDDYDELNDLNREPDPLQQEIEKLTPQDVTIPDADPGEDEAAAVEGVIEEVQVYLRYGLERKALELLDSSLKKYPRNQELQKALRQLRKPATAKPVSSEIIRKPAAPAKAPPAPPKKRPVVAKAPPTARPVAKPVRKPTKPKIVHSGGDTAEELENLFADIKSSVKMSLKNEDYEAHYNMGIGYKEMGMLDEAIEEFETAAHGESLFVNCQVMIGSCCMAKGKYADAIRSLKQCLSHPQITLESKQAIYYELGLAYEKIGKTRDALKAFARVYKIKPNFRDVTARIKRLKKRLAS